jgi:hypothetical protein
VFEIWDILYDNFVFNSAEHNFGARQLITAFGKNNNRKQHYFSLYVLEAQGFYSGDNYHGTWGTRNWLTDACSFSDPADLRPLK